MANVDIQFDYLTPGEAGEVEEIKDEKVEEGKAPEEKSEGLKEPAKKNPLDAPKFDTLSDEELEGAEEEGEEEPTETSPKPVKKEKQNLKQSVDFKALAEELIEDGVWSKWEDWDEKKDSFEWDEETFLNLQKEQVQYQTQKAIEEEKSTYGDQYKELLDYAKAGGKVENLFESVQNERDVDALDPEDIDDAKEILRAYHESLGWDATEIKEQLEILEDRGPEVLKKTAQKRKDTILESIRADRQEEIKRQEEYQKQVKVNFEKFKENTRQFIHKDDLPEREKKELEKFAFDYKYQRQDGKKLSELDNKLQEIYANPEKFAKFAKVLKNFDLVEDKTTTEKKVKRNLFKSIQEGQKDLGKNNSQSPEFVGKNKSKSGSFNPFQRLV